MIPITLCMIVKNEEAILAACLDKIAPYMDEIIVVDTGSTDKTKEIALRFTDKVYDYAWTDSFSDARNFSISKAGSEYILCLDSDEIVDSIDIIKIKQLIAENPKKIGRLLRINEFSRGDNFNRFYERVNRLFSKKHYRYVGIIHEQLENISDEFSISEDGEGTAIFYEKDGNISDEKLYSNTYLIPLTIRHSGYEGDLTIRKKKTQRNISLLKKALDKSPNDPYVHYQLGKSYYMEEDYLNASHYFENALSYDLNPTLEYVQDMVESYGYSLINSGQYEKSVMILNLYDDFSQSADFIFMAALIYMNNGNFTKAVEEFLKATEKKECRMEGVNGHLAFYNIAVIYECLGDIINARKYYSMCGDYKPALERLMHMLK